MATEVQTWNLGDMGSTLSKAVEKATARAAILPAGLRKHCEQLGLGKAAEQAHDPQDDAAGQNQPGTQNIIVVYLPRFEKDQEPNNIAERYHKSAGQP